MNIGESSTHDGDHSGAPAAPVIPLATPVAHDPYAALRFRDFRLLTIGRSISTLGEQMVSVAIGWELYERTNSALALGGVGLVQVLPVILLSLPAGHMADRLNRKRITIITQTMLALCSLGLALLSYERGSLLLVYSCLLLIGVARAFNDPASATLLPQTVPTAVFTNAVAWSNSVWQAAAVVGPALGGLVIGTLHSATLVYVFNSIVALMSVLLVALMQDQPMTRSSEETTLKSLAAGIRFVWQTKILMAAITLDLFAVLLGGATTLLPVFAKDILHVGPDGLGWLRTAPSIGAVVMAVVLAYLPPFTKAGRTLLLAVAGFGVATIVFGLSSSFALSMAMLVLLGALDNISVVIRSTLLLTQTPNAMRGRVSAVNSIFIGASNELGGFESGVVAALVGPIIAVVTGGIGTILVVLLVALIWPEMRLLRRLDNQKEISDG